MTKLHFTQQLQRLDLPSVLALVYVMRKFALVTRHDNKTHTCGIHPNQIQFDGFPHFDWVWICVCVLSDFKTRVRDR